LTFSVARKTAVEGSPASDHAIGIKRLVSNGAAWDVSRFGLNEKTAATSKSKSTNDLVMAEPTDTQRRKKEKRLKHENSPN
jgi:hypothetical protein